MPHALAGLGAEASDDQLVIAPHGSVEEEQRRAGQPRFQRVGDLGTSRDEVEMLAARLVADMQAERVAGAIVAAGMRLAFEIPGALAGYGERQDLQSGRRAAGQRRLE